jgi:hypothetical protein
LRPDSKIEEFRQIFLHKAKQMKDQVEKTAQNIEEGERERERERESCKWKQFMVQNNLFSNRTILRTE